MGIDQKKVKEKKEKKEKKEGAKERKKTPWKVRQQMRVERALKSLGKLNTTLVGAKAPNIEASLAQNSFTAISTLKVQIDMLPADWKPLKGASVGGTSKKIGIGSLVQVKDDLSGDPSAALYKMVDKKLFIGAEITGEDGETKKGFKYWAVKCADGTNRVMIKKHAVRHVAPIAAVPAPVAAVA